MHDVLENQKNNQLASSMSLTVPFFFSWGENTNKYIIKLNSNRCISCRACEAHCKVYNHTSIGVRLGKLISIGPTIINGQQRVITSFISCFHCIKSWCIAACPTGAMIKLEEYGLVVLQSKICIGCKACIEACPWSIPQWDNINRKVVKCDYCWERLRDGLSPACVIGCTSHALSFIEVNTESRRTRVACANTAIACSKKKHGLIKVT